MTVIIHMKITQMSNINIRLTLSQRIYILLKFKKCLNKKEWPKVKRKITFIWKAVLPQSCWRATSCFHGLALRMFCSLQVT